MSCDIVQKQGQANCESPGFLLSRMVLFDSAAAAVELFQTVQQASPCCTAGGDGRNVTMYCKYGRLQRYVCKDCRKTFNGKTGNRPALHAHRHGGLDASGLDVLGRARSGTSMRCMAESTGRNCKPIYHMMRAPWRILPTCRRGSCLGPARLMGCTSGWAPSGFRWRPTARTAPFPAAACLGDWGAEVLGRTSPMAAVYHQRATGSEPDIAIFDVPRDHSGMPV